MAPDDSRARGRRRDERRTWLLRSGPTGVVPNAVAVAADRDGIIYEHGAGPRSPVDATTVNADSRFRIMSMTKIVVTVVALHLAEQYKLDLEGPVEEYCPQFADVQVLERIDEGRPVLRPPAGKATVSQLITHTSGLAYWFWNDEMAAWEQATGTPNPLSGYRRVFDAPLVADPGTEFVYGLGTDWLGLVIEAVTGSPLDEVVRAIVTEPLGMAQTAFALPGARRPVGGERRASASCSRLLVRRSWPVLDAAGFPAVSADAAR
jgi:methyl acetate hydrolase